MKIAIIDSGIDKHHQRLKGARITSFEFINNREKQFIKSKSIDKLGHGTGIASIIYKMVPEANLMCIKVFDNDLTCNENLLIDAINWSINQKVDIINLSLGIRSNTPSKRLHDVCKLAFKKEIALIAASDKQYNSSFYPAWFSEVIGVTGGVIKDVWKYGKLNNHPINFIAKGNTHRVANINNSFSFEDGSSFACAYMTGIIAKLILELKTKNIYSINLLFNTLSKNADEIIKPKNYYKSTKNSMCIISAKNERQINELFVNAKLNWINKFSIFPASEKEMKIFANFEHLCKKELIKVIDYPRSLQIKDSLFKNVQDWMLDEKDFSNFDTLVIGYFHEHLFEGNVNFGIELLKRALKNGKNIFAFDLSVKNIINQEINFKYKSKIYSPIVDKDILTRVMSFAYKNKVKTPIIAVIGTGSSQGKFTVQLRIKEILEKEGYSVSHISTEPHGGLFGADYSFPMGYNSTVKFSQKYWAEFLRRLIRILLKYKHTDILLTGIQSWTISTVGFPKLTGTELRALEFLLGVEPDGIICTINPNDSIEKIKKNITAAQLVTNASVIFYTITPYLQEIVIPKAGTTYKKLSILSKEELAERKMYYSAKLNAEVFDILDYRNDNIILNVIQNFFSN